MLMVCISSIVNFIVIYVMFLLPYVYIAKLNGTPGHLLYYAVACFMLQLMLLILGMTRKGYWFVSLYQSYRKPVEREIDYFKPLAEEVILQQNQVYSTRYKYADFNFYVSDIQEPNAYAFSQHCIIMTTGFLGFATDAEFKAVLAHEMGHLYYRDTQMLMAGLLTELPTRIFDRLYKICVSICMPFMKPHGTTGIIGLFVGGTFLLIFLPFWLVARCSSWLFDLLLKLTSKSTEYRADYHAYKLGYAEGMISFLEKISQMTAHDSSFFADMLATHPAPLQRIGRLDGYVHNGTVAAYDAIKPLDKFLATLGVVLILGSGLIAWGYFSYAAAGKAAKKSVQAEQDKSAKLHKQLHNPDAEEGHTSTAPWVYIYNTTTVDQKCCRVDYKLENQGQMQHMMVRQYPRKYRMSLKDLEALQ